MAAYGALLGLYVAWAFDPLIRFEAGFVAWDPRVLFAYMRFLYEHGAWEWEGDREYVVAQGVFLLACWLGELGVTIGTAASVAAGFAKTPKAPFCERCNQWAKTEDAVAELKPSSDEASSLERLAGGDLSVLDDFQPASEDDSTYVWLDLTTCPTCQTFTFLTVRLVRKTVHPDGSVGIESHELLSNVRINEAQLRRIREKAQDADRDA